MAESSGVRAGSAFVEVGANLSGVEIAFRKLDQMAGAIGKSFDAVGSKVSSIGSGVATLGGIVGAAGTAVIAPIVGMAKAFADAGSEVADASARTGASASSLSQLGYAAAQTGSDLGTVTAGINKMQKGIVAGSEGIEGLGIDMESLAKKSPDQQFEMIGRKIAEISDPTERAAAAMKIFGKSGTSLLPLFADLDALKKEAVDLGIALSDQDASNADRLGDAFDRIAAVTKGIGLRVGAAIAEPLASILETTAKIASIGIEWAKNNQGVIQTVAAIGAGAVAVGTVIAGIGAGVIAVGAAISSVGVIVGGIGTAFSAVGAIVGAIVSPIGIVVAGVAALGGYIVYASGALDGLGAMFGTIGETATTAWAGIVAALGSGDLEAVGKIAFTALEVAWLTVTSTMQEAWGFLGATFSEVGRTITQAGLGIWHGMEAAADQAAAFILRAFDETGAAILNTFDSIDTAIQKAVIELSKFLGLVDAKTATQTQTKLDDELSKRKQGRRDAISINAEGRQQNIDERANARQKQVDATNKFFDSTTESFLTQKQDPALEQRKAELAKLREELATLSGDAQAKAADAKPTPPPPGTSIADKVAARSAIAAQPQPLEAKQEAAATAIQFASAESVGSFSGKAAAAQGFVSVSIQEEQRNLLQSIAATNEQQLAIAQRQDEREAD